MIPRHRLAVVPALAMIGAVALTGCTSSSSTPAKRSSASGTSTEAVGRSTDASTLASTLQRGLATATSAHLAVSTMLSGQALTGSGDVTLSAGAISRADLQQALPSGLGAITVVVVGSNTYARLPSALRTGSSKPWVLLTSNSKNAVVAELAAAVQPVLAVAAPATLVSFTRAASAVTDLGTSTTGGVTTAHYRVVVDATKLPASVPSSITGGGKSSIMIDLYLDADGRPHQVSGTFSISGQAVTPTIVLTQYNAPVSITAPPASQVGTR